MPPCYCIVHPPLAPSLAFDKKPAHTVVMEWFCKDVAVAYCLRGTYACYAIDAAANRRAHMLVGRYKQLRELPGMVAAGLAPGSRREVFLEVRLAPCLCARVCEAAAVTRLLR